MSWAIVVNDVVVNVIECDKAFAEVTAVAMGGFATQSKKARRSHIHSGGRYAAPPPSLETLRDQKRLDIKSRRKQERDALDPGSAKEKDRMGALDRATTKKEIDDITW